MATNTSSITIENDIVVEVQPNLNDLTIELLDQLRPKLGPLEINGRTLMIAMRYAMELVELTELKGEEHKQLVTRILQQLANDAQLSEKKEQLCLKLINSGIIGQTIDLIVDASKGNMKINEASRIATAITTQAIVETKCCGLF